MKKYICILASAALLVACEQKTETAAPAASPAETENNTTVVNPPASTTDTTTNNNTTVTTTPAESTLKDDPFSRSVKRGRAVYEKSNCSQCHGQDALGDGPSAHELKDDWGNSIVPYDLTTGHIKCGDKGQDIYRVFITGLNGTPMPSFSDSISEAEAWDLVHYIQSLSELYPKNLETAAK